MFEGHPERRDADADLGARHEAGRDDLRASLETTKVALGFIPLTDCAPLAVAYEKGFFAQEGMTVSLSREASWANIRDKVTVGALDGAQMLAGMPIAASLGVFAIEKPMIAPMALDLNGNAVTLSTHLFERMQALDPVGAAERPMTARALKAAIECGQRNGEGPLTFAVVFPTSTHNYQLRYWLAAAGIDPDRDMRIVTVPPPQMVAHLEAGNIDGFCVGEPWGQRAAQLGVGRVAITSYEIWNNGAEKVFAVSQDWAERNPNSLQALLRALIQACRWVDKPENRLEAAAILSRPDYVGAPMESLAPALTGAYPFAAGEAPRHLPDFHVFHRYAATFPWRSQAQWLLGQMQRWGQVDPAVDAAAVAAQVYRPDLYRRAAAAVGCPYPLSDHKIEGVHAAPWILTDASEPIPMGPDLFFDGARFDPVISA